MTDGRYLQQVRSPHQCYVGKEDHLGEELRIRGPLFPKDAVVRSEDWCGLKEEVGEGQQALAQKTSDRFLI